MGGRVGQVGMEMPGTWCWGSLAAEFLGWHLGHALVTCGGGGGRWGEVGVAGQDDKTWVGLESAPGPHSPSSLLPFSNSSACPCPGEVRCSCL